MVRYDLVVNYTMAILQRSKLYQNRLHIQSWERLRSLSMGGLSGLYTTFRHPHHGDEQLAENATCGPAEKEFVSSKASRIAKRKWAAAQQEKGNLPKNAPSQPMGMKAILLITSTLGILLFAYRMYITYWQSSGQNFVRSSQLTLRIAPLSQIHIALIWNDTGQVEIIFLTALHIYSAGLGQICFFACSTYTHRSSLPSIGQAAGQSGLPLQGRCMMSRQQRTITVSTEFPHALILQKRLAGGQ